MYTLHLVIGAIILLFFYVYCVLKKAYSYFDQNDIPYVKPTFIFGNVKDFIMRRKPLQEVFFELHKQLEPYRFGGAFIAIKKFILIRDPDLIKDILTKDFSHFYDRGMKRDPHVDKLGSHLLTMTGKEWKNLRIKLIGAFTSTKMKMMFPLVKEYGNKLADILDGTPNKEEFDVKDICVRYTTDVIGSCAFGLDINSLDNPDSEFRMIGKRIFDVKFVTIIRRFYPKLIKYFRSFLIDLPLENFFLNLFKETVKYREENNITRGDFLDLLIALKNDTGTHKVSDKHEEQDRDKFLTQVGEKSTKPKIEMTTDLMSAICFGFFAAGFEPASNTLSFMMLELAQSQDIQDKLRDEIITVLENNDNQLTYDVLKQMKYLDMVIAETLRKYQVTGSLLRICTETYKIPDSMVTIPQGTFIFISILGIHHDEKYYEKPYEFYPEHFTEQARAKRPHYAYLPFGEGPRKCIGELFGNMKVKIGAINLLRNFSYHLSPRTKLPIEFTPGLTNKDIKGGIWLRCQRI